MIKSGRLEWFNVAVFRFIVTVMSTWIIYITIAELGFIVLVQTLWKLVFAGEYAGLDSNFFDHQPLWLVIFQH